MKKGNLVLLVINILQTEVTLSSSHLDSLQSEHEESRKERSACHILTGAVIFFFVTIQVARNCWVFFETLVCSYEVLSWDIGKSLGLCFSNGLMQQFLDHHMICSGIYQWLQSWGGLKKLHIIFSSCHEIHMNLLTFP